jgi:hypothetical protein
MHPETDDHLVNLRRGGSVSTRHHLPQTKELPNPRSIQNIKDLQEEPKKEVRVAVSQEQKTADDKDILISWKAPNFEKVYRGKNWYAGLIVITGSLIAFAFYTNNPMFIVLISLAVATLLVRHKTKPHPIDFAISKKGVVIENRLFEFRDLKSFCFIDLPADKKELVLLSGKKFMPALKMIVTGQNEEELKKTLLEHIPENETYEEPLLDILERMLKI